MNLSEETFVCVDCETTGLDTKQDRVIEVAVVSFTLNSVIEEYESLVDPKREIPEDSIKIHNITQDMVSGQPTISQVLPEVLRIIDKHIIVGHGIGFDIDILAEEAERYGIATTIRKNESLDTLRMARLYGESPTNSLEKLRAHFNIEEEGAHRAMNDVVVNMEVFKHLSKKYKTTDQLFKTLSKPIALKKMPLGKHKGRPLKEIPLDYLRWAAKKDFDQDLLFSLRSEIKRRKQGNTFSQSGNPFAGL